MLGISAAPLLGSAACDRQPTVAELLASRPPPTPASASTPDASDLQPVASDPPPAPGDLKGDIDAFTTLSACVTSHAHLDPLVGDAVEAIGYDTLIRDACSVVDAAKALDARRCSAIDVTTLRERCVATVAELAEKADTCPWQVADRPLRGRDPGCVAIASRDARLCASVLDETERATCAAIAGREAAPCAKLPREADRLRCERSAERWRAAIPAAPAKTAFAVAGELHFEALEGGPATDVDFTQELERGLVLQEQRTGSRFAFGPAHGESDRLVPPIDRHDEVALEIVVPPPAPGKSDVPSVRIERFDAIVRGVSLTIVPFARTAGAGDSGLTAKIVSFERVRGGRVEIAIDGSFSDGPHASKGHLRIATFVRDLVRPADVYAPLSRGAPPRGDLDRAVALDAGGAEP